MSLSHRTRTATATTSHSSLSGPPSASRSLSESLLGEGGQEEEYARPPSPGLPLHRETSGMSNLELHESGSAASQRRHGGPASTSSGTASYGANGMLDDLNEKDYLLDRPDNGLANGRRRDDNGKEKEKWSKLIPEDLLGGRANARHSARQRRSGLSGVVSVLLSAFSVDLADSVYLFYVSRVAMLCSMQYLLVKS